MSPVGDKEAGVPCYINLPLRWVYAQPLWTEWFISGHMAPELGLDATSLGLPDSWHSSLAEKFRTAGLACAVHLPFLGVDPGDADAAKAEESGAALRRGAEIAKIYGARHMVGHPNHREDQPLREAAWLAASRRVWSRLPAIGNAPLFLENTCETSPEGIAHLVSLLQEDLSGGPGIGVCFDLGHWHSFAGKHQPEDLDPWLCAFAPFALHLHLHDNEGKSDQHLGLGKGSVPFAALFARLAKREAPLTATLEPHDTQAFVASIAWLAAHADAAGTIGWEAPLADALPLAEIAKHIREA